MAAALTTHKQHALDTRLRILENEIRRLRAQRNKESPISKIPVELVCKIFVLANSGCIFSNPNYPASATLCRVSRSWREIALGCRELWTTILIHPTMNPRQIEFLWRNTKSYPFDLSVDTRLPETPILEHLPALSVDVLARMIARSQDRIQSLRIHWSTRDSVTIFDKLAHGSTFALLEEVILVGVMPFASRIFGGHVPESSRFFSCRAPKLKSATFDGWADPWKSELLKSSSQFTDMTANSNMVNTLLSTDDLFAFLQHPGQGLQTLRLTSNMNIEAIELERELGRRLSIHLPNTVEVNLASDNWDLPLCLLNAVRFGPLLSSFTLVCRNAPAPESLWSVMERAFANTPPYTPDQVDFIEVKYGLAGSSAGIRGSMSVPGRPNSRLTIGFFLTDFDLFLPESLATQQLWSFGGLRDLVVHATLPPMLWETLRMSSPLEVITIGRKQMQDLLPLLTNSKPGDGSRVPFSALRILASKGMGAIRLCGEASKVNHGTSYHEVDEGGEEAEKDDARAVVEAVCLLKKRFAKTKNEGGGSRCQIMDIHFIGMHDIRPTLLRKLKKKAGANVHWVPLPDECQ